MLSLANTGVNMESLAPFHVFSALTSLRELDLSELKISPHTFHYICSHLSQVVLLFPSKKKKKRATLD
jgi:hypothetical protein